MQVVWWVGGGWLVGWWLGAGGWLAGWLLLAAGLGTLVSIRVARYGFYVKKGHDMQAKMTTQDLEIVAPHETRIF